MTAPNLDNILAQIQLYAGDIDLWVEINFTNNLAVSDRLATLVENHLRSVFSEI